MMGKITEFLYSSTTWGIMILVGLCSIAIGYAESNKFNSLASHGKLTTAEVTEVEWKKRVLSGQEQQFKVNVRYKNGSGDYVYAVVSVKDELGRKIRDDASIKTIDIRYLPENPGTAYVAEEVDHSLTCFAIGIPCLIFGILLAFSSYRRDRG